MQYEVANCYLGAGNCNVQQNSYIISVLYFMLNQIHLLADGVASRPLLAGDITVVGGLPLACGLPLVDGMSAASSNE